MLPSPNLTRRAIIAASLGAIFEWYDFFLYGSLAVFFGQLFFPSDDPLSSLLISLAVFGAGFVVRPLGGAVFGYIGDKIGRKIAFLATIITMGLSTAAIGIIPTYEDIGIIAPIILVLLRLLQGLALGGEYGGAAIYVAEHVSVFRRGFYTSWIQTTATVGFLISLLVILACQYFMTLNDFKSWGWRIPFLFSLILLGISIYIRLKLKESPIFKKMQEQKQLSKQPLKESFFNPANRYYLVLALVVTAGQGAICYAAQFYALIFLQNSIKLDMVTSYLLVGSAQIIAIPFFPLFGWLSDKFGRKIILLAGFCIPVLTFLPAFEKLSQYINPALVKAEQAFPITLQMKANCGLDCQIAIKFLNSRGISYNLQANSIENAQSGILLIGTQETQSLNPKEWEGLLKQAGYPTGIDYQQINYLKVIIILSFLMICVALVYAPIGAFLVDIFPARIRYSSLSVTYHIGSGWFGGFMPLVATALISWTGNIHAGLWYPTIVAAIVFLLSFFLLSKKTISQRVMDDEKLLSS